MVTSLTIAGADTLICIFNHISGKSAQWSAEGEEVEALRDWASKLEYELFEFEEGQSPGDSDGGEVYDFVLTEGGYPGFSYVIGVKDLSVNYLRTSCFIVFTDKS